MDTPGAAEAAALLRDFRFVDPTWDGTAFVPFWGRDLEVSLDPDEDGITPRQLDVLRAVLTHPKDLRPAFERGLFAYYKADVEGSWSAVDGHGREIPGSGPPKLTEPAQVWGLIDDPTVRIDISSETESAVEFQLMFTCQWDCEHGLGVLYREWRPVEFGPWRL